MIAQDKQFMIPCEPGSIIMTNNTYHYLFSGCGPQREGIFCLDGPLVREIFPNERLFVVASERRGAGAVLFVITTDGVLGWMWQNKHHKVLIQP